ncbi:MAG TPA: dihydroneopterin aldolase, partial [Alphaproteobacteria bacterium]|nr:dihydroneopterin aldolase [Alphaproteobacteria bacterium]
PAAIGMPVSQHGLSAVASPCYGSRKMTLFSTRPSATPVIAAPGIRHLFVRDLVLTASIGVYEHEHRQAQRIRVNMDLAVEETGPAEDHLDRVVSYEPLVRVAREAVAVGHVRLVETLAERLAEKCLADRRVVSVRVRVEKLDVFPDAASAGVEIERVRT